MPRIPENDCSQGFEARARFHRVGPAACPRLELLPSAGMPSHDRDDHRENGDERRNGAHRHEGHQALTAAVTTPALAQRPAEWAPTAETPATTRRPARPSALQCVIVLQREFLFLRHHGQ